MRAYTYYKGGVWITPTDRDAEVDELFFNYWMEGSNAKKPMPTNESEFREWLNWEGLTEDDVTEVAKR